MIKRAVTGVKATFVILDAHRPCFPWLTHNGTPGSPAPGVCVRVCVDFLMSLIIFPFYCAEQADTNARLRYVGLFVRPTVAGYRFHDVTPAWHRRQGSSDPIGSNRSTIARSVCAALVSVCKVPISLIRVKDLIKNNTKKHAIFHKETGRCDVVHFGGCDWLEWIPMAHRDQKWVKESAIFNVFLMASGSKKEKGQLGVTGLECVCPVVNVASRLKWLPGVTHQRVLGDFREPRAFSCCYFWA